MHPLRIRTEKWRKYFNEVFLVTTPKGKKKQRRRKERNLNKRIEQHAPKQRVHKVETQRKTPFKYTSSRLSTAISIIATTLSPLSQQTRRKRANESSCTVIRGTHKRRWRIQHKLFKEEGLLMEKLAQDSFLSCFQQKIWP